LQKNGGYIYAAQASVDMDISMDIHGKSVNIDMDTGGKFHYIHGKFPVELGPIGLADKL